MKKIFIALAAVIALAACGQSPKEEAFERLQNQVAAVRDAAEAREATTAVQRLTSLRTNVAQLREDGVLSEIETQKILTAALQVQSNLSWIAPAPLAPPVAAPAPVAPAGSSNAGGSITGSGGQPGAKGEKGRKGEKEENDD